MPPKRKKRKSADNVWRNKVKQMRETRKNYDEEKHEEERRKARERHVRNKVKRHSGGINETDEHTESTDQGDHTHIADSSSLDDCEWEVQCEVQCNIEQKVHVRDRQPVESQSNHSIEDTFVNERDGRYNDEGNKTSFARIVHDDVNVASHVDITDDQCAYSVRVSENIAKCGTEQQYNISELSGTDTTIVDEGTYPYEYTDAVSETDVTHLTSDNSAMCVQQPLRTCTPLEIHKRATDSIRVHSSYKPHVLDQVDRVCTDQCNMDSCKVNTACDWLCSKVQEGRARHEKHCNIIHQGSDTNDVSSCPEQYTTTNITTNATNIEVDMPIGQSYLATLEDSVVSMFTEMSQLDLPNTEKTIKYDVNAPEGTNDVTVMRGGRFVVSEPCVGKQCWDSSRDVNECPRTTTPIGNNMLPNKTLQNEAQKYSLSKVGNGRATNEASTLVHTTNRLNTKEETDNICDLERSACDYLQSQTPDKEFDLNNNETTRTEGRRMCVSEVCTLDGVMPTDASICVREQSQTAVRGNTNTVHDKNTIERNKILKREHACLLRIQQQREEYFASKRLIDVDKDMYREQSRVYMEVKRRNESADERSRRLENNRVRMARSRSVSGHKQPLPQTTTPGKPYGNGDEQARRRDLSSPSHLRVGSGETYNLKEQSNIRKRNSCNAFDVRLSERGMSLNTSGMLQATMDDHASKKPRRESVTVDEVHEQNIQGDGYVCVDNEEFELQENDQDVISDGERIRNIRNELVTSLANDDFSFNAFHDNPLVESGREFYTELEKTEWTTCVNCKETWINMRVGPRSQKCARCSGTRGKIFGIENDMDPGVAPDVLTRLTPIEKSAISIICPSICIYKGGITSSSSKGHCVSFYQDVHTLATTLPRLPSDLNVVVIKHPNERITDKTFTVRRQYLIDALQFLTQNSPDYKDIVIDHGNANAYPLDDIIQDVRQITPDDLQIPTDQQTAENPESTTFNTSTVDMPIPMKTVDENIAEVLQNDPNQNAMIHEDNQPGQIVDQQPQPVPIPWPKRNDDAASEFTFGFFSKSFPDLFPYGRGDITKPRTHKNPSLLDYFQHLMRVNRDFVTHHAFTFVATNMWRRHNALTLGNVFTKTSADGLTMKDLKEAVENGDDAVLKKLLYFASPIVGTRQNLRYKSDQALSFVDYVRIDSEDKKMFDMFQTFSAADLHWDDLHRILPGSERYLGKIVVKSMEDVPDNADPRDYIDAQNDFLLRTHAVKDNADVVASYIKIRHTKFLNTVMTKLGVEDYIVRYEDQGRGCLHTHDLFVMKDGVSAKTLEKAYKKITTTTTEEDIDNIVVARQQVKDFSVKTLGVSATHPNKDPTEWPGPYGANVHTPPENCLRKRFRDLDTPELLKEHHEQLINRTMLHKCRIGYCLSENNKAEDGSLKCRFHFPMEPFGYVHQFNEVGNQINSVERTNEAQDGAQFVNADLLYARNHPTLVHHVPEILTCWCANIEGRSVVSYRQVVNYLMKYMMKPEPNSAPFTSITRAIVDDADENQPVRKTMQKILMKTVGENDMSKQMCHHILSGNDIVEFSLRPNNVNVMRTRRINDQNGNGKAAKENYADVYWGRDTDPNYIRFCEEFDAGKTTIDPRTITLYEFSSKYTKKWQFSGEPKFPHITPSFKFVPKKDGKYHERYLSFLKSILLVHKSGTTFADIDALTEEELEEQVEEFCSGDICPTVIREKYTDSQTGVIDDDEEAEEDQANNDNPVPELLIEPEHEEERYDQEEWMTAVGEIVQRNDQIIDQMHDNDSPNILDEFKNFDWESDRTELELTEDEVHQMPKWLEQEKHEHPDIQRDDVDNGGVPESLNAKQFTAFAIIRDYVLRVQQHGIDNVPQLLLNISGGAGSGKTFLLNVVKRFISETLNDSKFVAAAAPSGTAAFLINGETLHGLLYLPLETRKLPKLQGDKLRQLQRKLERVGILFLDEKSMIGQSVFAMVSQRLQEAKPHKANVPFGGVSIVLMGDWVQLPPVLDKSLFDSDTTIPAAYNLYRLFQTVVILDVIQRQQDTQFSDELRRLATGTFTKDDWLKWQTRSLHTLSAQEQDDFTTNALYACAKKEDMTEHNIRKVRENNQPIAEIHAECNCSEARKESADRQCNLPKKICISKDTTVRLTSNLWTVAGLTNGSVGTVHRIIYERGEKPPKLPMCIIATFDSYIGPPFLEDLEKSVVIVPVRREWLSNGITCSRIMLPLILGYALSVHRLQGQTEEKIIFNPGDKEFAAGLMYVGASRTKTFGGLAFSPFPNFERFEKISKSPALRKRLNEELRLQTLQDQTIAVYSDVVAACMEAYGVNAD